MKEYLIEEPRSFSIYFRAERLLVGEMKKKGPPCTAAVYSFFLSRLFCPRRPPRIIHMCVCMCFERCVIGDREVVPKESSPDQEPLFCTKYVSGNRRSGERGEQVHSSPAAGLRPSLSLSLALSLLLSLALDTYASRGGYPVPEAVTFDGVVLVS